MKTQFIFLCALAALFAPRSHAGLILTLPGNGVVSAGFGGTTGWGFTLDFTNDPGDLFALIISSDFCTGVQSSPCSNPLGSYSDIISDDNFTVVGPSPESSIVSQPFDPDPNDPTGIGSFLVNGVGSSISGNIILTYDLYATDPANGGNPVQTDLTAEAPATVLVAGNTPEPPTFLLLLPPGCFVLVKKYLRDRLSDTASRQS